MHRLSLMLITLLSALQAQEYTLAPISIQEMQDTFIQTQEEALSINAFTLQERLKNDISFDSVAGEKNGEGLSFRGLDDRAIGYFEDGIPLYRSTSGESATIFYALKGTIDNTSSNNTGVSSMGADVQIKLSKDIEENTLYLAVAHKSRFPSMTDMYPLLFRQSVYPGLKPEQSQNLEVGYENRTFSHTLLTYEWRYGYPTQGRSAFATLEWKL